MTQLRKRVLEELERRNYSQATARVYVGAIRRFAEYFHRSPDRLGIEEVRQYQVYLFKECKLKPHTVMQQMCALRFLYCGFRAMPISVPSRWRSRFRADADRDSEMMAITIPTGCRSLFGSSRNGDRHRRNCILKPS